MLLHQKNRVWVRLVVGVLGCGALVGHVRASTPVTLNDGAVHDVSDGTFSGNFLILEDGPGVAPDGTTLNLMAGGEVNTPPMGGDDTIGVDADGNSVIGVSGGEINASGTGSTGVRAADLTMFDITAGQVTAGSTGSTGLFLLDDASAEIDGGSLSASGLGSAGIRAIGNSVTNITAGMVSANDSGADAVQVQDDAMVTISGGVLDAQGFGASGISALSGQVDITGGTIGATGSASAGVDAVFDAVVTIDAGNITGDTAVDVSFNSTTTINGGTITGDSYGVWTTLSGVVEIRGGDISGGVMDLRALNTSTIRVIGSDFDRPHGTTSDLTGTFSGILEDGTPFTYTFERAAGSALIVTPSPSTVTVLLPMLVAGVARRKRRR